PLPFEENDGARRLAFSPDGQRLATVGKTVRLWDLTAGKELHRLKHDTGGITCVAFHPDGKRFASADADGTVKLWDARTGRELRAYRGHTNSVNGLAFSPDSGWFVTASDDQTVRVWDATLGARDWHGPEAREVVQARFERLLFRDDVVASLRGDST